MKIFGLARPAVKGGLVQVSMIVRVLMTLAAGMLLHGSGQTQPADPTLSRHLQNVQARDKVLPLDVAGTYGAAGAITLDGKLNEWGSFSRRSGIFIQDLDHLAYQLPDEAKDAAGVKLLRDDKALYIAVRVVDASVYNVTTTEREYIRQDCVEIFLDTRPLTTFNKPKLGDSDRSDGFYQLFFVPPTPARPGSPARPVRWCSAPAQANLAHIGPLEVAGSLQPDGYDLEIRIPFTSLSGGSRERFHQAIGFDIFVDDMDLQKDSDTGPARTTASHVYAWGGLSGGYGNPSRLAAAAPDIPFPQKPNAYARVAPARLIAPRQASVPAVIDAIDSKYSLRAAIIASMGKTPLGSIPSGVVPSEESVSIELEYSGTAFDSALGTYKPATEVASLRSRAYASLDANVFFRDLTLMELPGGRYTCRTKFKGVSLSGKSAEDGRRADGTEGEMNTTRYYAWAKDDGTTLLQISNQTPDMDMEQAFERATVFVELANHFPETNGVVTGKLSVAGYSLLPAALWNFSEQAEQAIRQGRTIPQLYRVTLRKAGNEGVLHTVDVPFRAYPVPFTFAASTLAPGNYELQAVPVEEVGAVNPVKNAVGDAGQRPRAELVPFSVVGPRPITMTATVREDAKLLRQAIEIGSPNRTRHPLDDVYNAPQRSIWALQKLDDRIYVGSGIDYEYRQFIPPTTDELDIWSFSPAQARGKTKVEWSGETRLALSQVAALRATDDGLYASTIRNRWWQQAYQVHAKLQGQWETLSQPAGWQLNDLLPFGGKLYAAAGALEGAGLLESSDKGRTWKTVGTLEWPYSYFDLLAPTPQGLLATVNLSERGALLYRDGQMEPLRIDLFPGYAKHRGMRTHRLQPFAGGVVYTVPPIFDQTPKRRPLFYLQDLTQGAVQIEPFSEVAVQDIKIADGQCYVLTATVNNESNSDNPGFVASIFSTSDLRVWTKRATVDLPALPNALEIDGDTFFVGLANRHFGYADPASGSIWMIRE